MRVWVPLEPLAEAIRDVPGIEVGVFNAGFALNNLQTTDPGGASREPSDAPAPDAYPAGIEEVEFFVPPFFPTPASLDVIPRMRRLRVVQTLTAGVDMLVPRIPDGVTLCNARGVHDAGTAEWVVAAILAVLREFPRFALAQAQRRWDFRFTDSLAGKTVLIVGYGSIGAAVERRLAGFEVEVRRVARGERDGVAPVSALPGLLPTADVVVLQVPVTSETVGMVDASFLARMKDGALLVNAARGSIVETSALLGELRRGRLRAAVDVTVPEPLPPDHPLWTAPNVLITPHVAGSSPISAFRALGLIRDQLKRYMAGEKLRNVVTGAY